MPNQSQLADDIAALEATVNQNTQDIAGLKEQFGSIGTGAQGPVGPAGPPGPQGPQGIPGPAGADGTGSVTLTQDQIVAAIIAALGGASGGTPSGGGTGGGTSTVDYFPADPGVAPFPSPENSTIIAMSASVLEGPPYLRSLQGAIWQFDKDATGNLIPVVGQYGNGYQASVNGQPIANTPITQLIVRQGQIWFEHEGVGGRLTQADAVMSGVTNGSFPPAWTSSGMGAGGGTIALPPMPTPPAPVSPAPGSSGKTISFSNQADLQAAHDAASPGDTLVYSGAAGAVLPIVLAITKPLVIDGGGRTQNPGSKDATYTPGLIIDVSPLPDPSGYPHQIAALVPMTDCMIKGFQGTGAGMAEDQAGGTAAIRPGAPCNVQVDHCFLLKNQNGFGPNDLDLHTFTVTNTILLDNGLGSADTVSIGRSHNAYFGHGCVSLTMGPGVTSIVNPMDGISGGHALKSRANVTTLVGPSYFWSGDSSSVDYPSGSTQVCQIGPGVTLAKRAGDENHAVISFATDTDTPNGLAGVAAAAGAIIDTECDNPLIQANGPVSFAAGVIFTGNKPTGPSNVTGLPT